MRYSILCLIGVCFILSNCSTTYTVKFEEPNPELVTTDKLKSFLNDKEEIKVVLRTSKQADDVTANSTYSPIYNTIEKELLKAGYLVRDRAIFNQVVSKSAEKVDYSELQEQTDTDLIIELVDFNTKVPYTTNTYYKKGEEKTFKGDNTMTYYGADAEFRVIMLENNRFAGSYSFNYAPCPEGCPIKINSNGIPRFVDKKIEEDEGEEASDDPYQYVPKPVMEQFMQNATQRLINSME